MAETFGCGIPSRSAASRWLSPRSSRRSLRRIASMAFAVSSSASGNPRSARTLSVAACLPAFRTIASPSIARMTGQHRAEPPLNQLDLRSRRCDPPFCLLLRSMQDVDVVTNSHCVPRSVGVAAMVFDEFVDAGPQPLPRFGRRRGPARLHQEQRDAQVLLDSCREALEVFLG